MSCRLPPPGEWYPTAWDGHSLSWRHLPGVRFDEPFFEDTLRRHRGAGECDSPVAALAEIDAPDPAAFIFHISRCRSTLAISLLRTWPGVRGIAEPPVLDDLLHDPGVGDHELLGLCRSFGRAPGVTRTIIKLDCWHLNQLPRFRRVFPETPMFFLHRDLDEVLASHRRIPGMHTVPGLVPADRLGVEPGPPHDLAGHAARVVRHLSELGQAAATRGELIAIDHRELPAAVQTVVAPMVGLPPACREDFDRVAGRDAKSPAMSWREISDT